MKNKVVIWGTDDQEQKILVALELLADENKVNVYAFSEQDATEEFYKAMLTQWRNGKEVSFPDKYQRYERELNMSEDLLPESIKVLESDVINRAKTEWHFTVLSAKLFQMYKSELEDLKEKVSGLVQYDSGLWEEMKGFWAKVQNQVIEKNLFRHQGNELRNSTNELFDKLKGLRKSLDDEFKKVSKANLEKFATKLTEVEGKIEKGLGLNPLFNELKNIQSDFKDTKFSREDRTAIWNRIDKAFKTVKEKKYGKSSGGSHSAMGRLKNRYEGLLSAIDKMEQSINRDEKDMVYQDRKIENSEGQLEAQIRQAKIQMVKERIKSKKVKLEDMLKTKLEIEERMKKQEKVDAKNAEKDKVEKAKKQIAADIKDQIAKQSSELEKDAEKLTKAASAVKEGKAKKALKKKPAEAVSETPKAEATVESIVEAPKAAAADAAETIVDKVENVVDGIVDKLKTAAAIAVTKVDEVVSELDGKSEEE